MRIEEWLEREAVRWHPLIGSDGEREKENGARAMGSVTDDLFYSFNSLHDNEI